MLVFTIPGIDKFAMRRTKQGGGFWSFTLSLTVYNIKLAQVKLSVKINICTD